MGNKFIRFPKEMLERGLVEFMEKSHFRVYTVLDYFKNKNTWKCFPSIKTICRKSKLSKSVIFKALKDLEYWGLIRTEERPGKTTVYEIIREPNIRFPTLNSERKFLRNENATEKLANSRIIEGTCPYQWTRQEMKNV